MSKSARASYGRLDHSFTVPQMYDLIRGSSASWGLEGYQVPKIDFDSKKHAEEKEAFLKSIGKQKKKEKQKPVDKTAKRGGIFDALEKSDTDKHPKPAPWQYEQSNLWLQQPKNKFKDIPPVKMQKQKFKWKKTGDEDQVIRKPEIEPKTKIDKTVSKRTFIDQIVTSSKKKDYPIPGPGQHFLDKKAAKYIVEDEEKRAVCVYESKDTGIKASNTSKAPRTLSFIDEKRLLKEEEEARKRREEIEKDDPKTKKAPESQQRGIKFKDYQELIKKKREEQTNKIRAERDRINEIKEKIKGGVPKDPLPLPADFMTFQKFSQLSKDYKKKKGNGLGIGDRFDERAEERWKKEVEHFNTVYTSEERQLDPKKDRSPGPAHYSVISGWQAKDNPDDFKEPEEGAARKKKKFRDKKFRNLFRKVSRGPQISIYYKSL